VVLRAGAIAGRLAAGPLRFQDHLFFSIFLWSLFTMFMGGVGFFTGAAAVAAVHAAPADRRGGSAVLPRQLAHRLLVVPDQERGTAAAIFNSAQYFATVLFAPIMGWLVHSFGWESVFFVMGGLGIVMAFIWLKTIRPERPPARQRSRAGTSKPAALVDLESRTRRPPPPSSIPGPASSSCWATACCWACTSASTASTPDLLLPDLVPGVPVQERT
jgi:MFS family permease